MANGKIRFGKQSGGTLGLIFPDGVTDTEVVFPESGDLVNKDYVDGAIWSTKQYVDDNTVLSPNDSNVKTALNASGEAPIYACRAWVNFNGTGTVAIRASGNVSSIADNGVGTYTVNFATAMPDANYGLTSVCQEQGVVNNLKMSPYTPYSATSVTLYCNYGTASAILADSPMCLVSVFR